MSARKSVSQQAQETQKDVYEALVVREYYWLKDETEEYLPCQYMGKLSETECSFVQYGDVEGKPIRALRSRVAGKVAQPVEYALGCVHSDLVENDDISEPSILWSLRKRYAKDDIYSSIGPILIAVNPYKNLEQLYSPAKMSEYFVNLDVVSGGFKGPSNANASNAHAPAPHIWTIARNAYSQLCLEGRRQAIVISGESGSGKTEATKKCLQYLSAAAASAAAAGAASEDASLENDGEGKMELPIEDRVLGTNPLLESFGNSKTARNNNSSRFGKWLEINFVSVTTSSSSSSFPSSSSSSLASVLKQPPVLKLSGANITQYLLEKSRVVVHCAQERNYHIFYQLCADPQMNMRPATEYHYLNQSGVVDIDGVDDAADFSLTLGSFSDLRFPPSDQQAIFSALKAILCLGNVSFVANKSQEAAAAAAAGGELGLLVDSKGESDEMLHSAAALLGLDLGRLADALTIRTMIVRGEQVCMPFSAAQAVDARNAFAKEIYGRVFSQVVQQANISLKPSSVLSSGMMTPSKQSEGSSLFSKKPMTPSSPTRSASLSAEDTRSLNMERKHTDLTVGLLDIFGFEIFQNNSFEQLCINYGNEKLQQYFLGYVLKKEQQIYDEEGITFNRIIPKDNEDVLALLELKPSGIISRLEDEIKQPQGSDANFLRKIENDHNTKLPTARFYRDFKTKSTDFEIRHFAGSVVYDSTGFLEKNRDRLYEHLEDLVLESTNAAFRRIFIDHGPPRTDGAGAAGGIGPPLSSPRQASKQSTVTLATRFQAQLQSLMSALHSSDPHFVRCIKPNNVKEKNYLDVPLVLQQLRYSGVLEAIQIRKSGFPTRRTHAEFRKCYWALSGKTPTDLSGLTEAQKCALVIEGLASTHAQSHPQLFDKENIVMGKSIAFFRPELLAVLEKERIAKGMRCVMFVQAMARMMGTMRRYVLLSEGRRQILELMRQGRTKNGCNTSVLPSLIDIIHYCSVELGMISYILREARDLVARLSKVRDLLDKFILFSSEDQGTESSGGKGRPAFVDLLEEYKAIGDLLDEADELGIKGGGVGSAENSGDEITERLRLEARYIDLKGRAEALVVLRNAIKYGDEDSLKIALRLVTVFTAQYGPFCVKDEEEGRELLRVLNREIILIDEVIELITDFQADFKNTLAAKREIASAASTAAAASATAVFDEDSSSNSSESSYPSSSNLFQDYLTHEDWPWLEHRVSQVNAAILAVLVSFEETPAIAPVAEIIIKIARDIVAMQNQWVSRSWSQVAQSVQAMSKAASSISDFQLPISKGLKNRGLILCEVVIVQIQFVRNDLDQHMVLPLLAESITHVSAVLADDGGGGSGKGAVGVVGGVLEADVAQLEKAIEDINLLGWCGVTIKTLLERTALLSTVLRHSLQATKRDDDFEVEDGNTTGNEISKSEEGPKQGWDDVLTHTEDFAACAARKKRFFKLSLTFQQQHDATKRSGEGGGGNETSGDSVTLYNKEISRVKRMYQQSNKVQCSLNEYAANSLCLYVGDFFRVANNIEDLLRYYRKCALLEAANTILAFVLPSSTTSSASGSETADVEALRLVVQELNELFADRCNNEETPQATTTVATGEAATAGGGGTVSTEQGIKKIDAHISLLVERLEALLLLKQHYANRAWSLISTYAHTGKFLSLLKEAGKQGTSSYLARKLIGTSKASLVSEIKSVVVQAHNAQHVERITNALAIGRIKGKVGSLFPSQMDSPSLRAVRQQEAKGRAEADQELIVAIQEAKKTYSNETTLSYSSAAYYPSSPTASVSASSQFASLIQLEMSSELKHIINVALSLSHARKVWRGEGTGLSEDGSSEGKKAAREFAIAPFRDDLHKQLATDATEAPLLPMELVEEIDLLLLDHEYMCCVEALCEGLVGAQGEYLLPLSKDGEGGDKGKGGAGGISDELLSFEGFELNLAALETTALSAGLAFAEAFDSKLPAVEAGEKGETSEEEQLPNEFGDLVQATFVIKNVREGVRKGGDGWGEALNMLKLSQVENVSTKVPIVANELASAGVIVSHFFFLNEAMRVINFACSNPLPPASFHSLLELPSSSSTYSTPPALDALKSVETLFMILKQEKMEGLWAGGGQDITLATFIDTNFFSSRLDDMLSIILFLISLLQAQQGANFDEVRTLLGKIKGGGTGTVKAGVSSGRLSTYKSTCDQLLERVSEEAEGHELFHNLLRAIVTAGGGRGVEAGGEGGSSLIDATLVDTECISIAMFFCSTISIEKMVGAEQRDDMGEGKIEELEEDGEEEDLEERGAVFILLKRLRRLGAGVLKMRECVANEQWGEMLYSLSTNSQTHVHRVIAELTRMRRDVSKYAPIALERTSERKQGAVEGEGKQDIEQEQEAHEHEECYLTRAALLAMCEFVEKEVDVIHTHFAITAWEADIISAIQTHTFTKDMIGCVPAPPTPPLSTATATAAPSSSSFAQYTHSYFQSQVRGDELLALVARKKDFFPSFSSSSSSLSSSSSSSTKERVRLPARLIALCESAELLALLRIAISKPNSNLLTAGGGSSAGGVEEARMLMLRALAKANEDADTNNTSDNNDDDKTVDFSPLFGNLHTRDELIALKHHLDDAFFCARTTKAIVQGALLLDRNSLYNNNSSGGATRGGGGEGALALVSFEALEHIIEEERGKATHTHTHEASMLMYTGEVLIPLRKLLKDSPVSWLVLRECVSGALEPANLKFLHPSSFTELHTMLKLAETRIISDALKKALASGGASGEPGELNVSSLTVSGLDAAFALAQELEVDVENEQQVVLVYTCQHIRALRLAQLQLLKCLQQQQQGDGGGAATTAQTSAAKEALKGCFLAVFEHAKKYVTSEVVREAMEEGLLVARDFHVGEVKTHLVENLQRAQKSFALRESVSLGQHMENKERGSGSSVGGLGELISDLDVLLENANKLAASFTCRTLTQVIKISKWLRLLRELVFKNSWLAIEHKLADATMADDFSDMHTPSSSSSSSSTSSSSSDLWSSLALFELDMIETEMRSHNIISLLHEAMSSSTTSNGTSSDGLGETTANCGSLWQAISKAKQIQQGGSGDAGQTPGEHTEHHHALLLDLMRRGELEHFTNYLDTLMIEE